MAGQSTRWWGLLPSGKSMASGELEPGEPLIVNCPRWKDGKRLCPPAEGLCPDCVDDLRRVLADVPMLFDDLDVAIAGESRFVEHGAVRRDDQDEDDEDDDPGRGQNPAVLAQQRLTRALELASPWFDARSPERLARQLARHLDELADKPEIRRLARQVSQAAKRAHRVIDRPRDLWFYGPCPECGHDIRQERIDKDDTTTPVKCAWPKCGYAAPADVHHKRQLDAAEDKQMTITELVSAFELAGETVTRSQIEWWIRREVLPREERPIVRWVDGALVRTGRDWTYRVGDIRDLAVKAAIRQKTRM